MKFQLFDKVKVFDDEFIGDNQGFIINDGRYNPGKYSVAFCLPFEPSIYTVFFN